MKNLMVSHIKQKFGRLHDEQEVWDLFLDFIADLQQYVGDETKLLSMLHELSQKRLRLSIRERIMVQLTSLCLYEMLASQSGFVAAERCSTLFHGLIRDKGQSWNEAVSDYVQRMIGNQETPLRLVTKTEEWVRRLPDKFVPYLGEAAGFIIDEEEHIVCYREPEGSLVFLGLNDSFQTILCDEEEFSNEPPMYFTESTHFISPMYKLKKLRDICNYIIRSYKFPYIRIKIKMIYISDEVRLINEGDLRSIWVKSDGESLVVRDHPERFPLEHVGEGFCGFSKRMKNLVETTKKVYHMMPKDKLYTMNDIGKIIAVPIFD